MEIYCQYCGVYMGFDDTEDPLIMGHKLSICSECKEITYETGIIKGNKITNETRT